MSEALFFETEARALKAELDAAQGGAPLVLLEGPLGAGKTSFTKTLLSLYGIAPDSVQSPTFLKVIEHRLPAGGAGLHMDAYRIDDEGEFSKLGLEAYEDAQLWIVEWPELFLKWLDEVPARKSALGIGGIWGLKLALDASTGAREIKRWTQVRGSGKNDSSP